MTSAREDSRGDGARLARLPRDTKLSQRRASLAEAAQVLGELTEEARQLHDTKELLAWIEAGQHKLGPSPQP